MSDEGTVSYATVKSIPGGVSVSLEPQGELTAFYADGIKYYVAASNAGYEGDLEMALVPDEFREEILQEEKDANGVIFENANKESAEFAIGFDIDGDQHTTRFWFYNCTATRPTVESSTTEDSKEPTTDKITISCAAADDGIVRAKTTVETTDEVYNNWYKTVYRKNESEESAETESAETESTESDATE